jgi:hypothetical protein
MAAGTGIDVVFSGVTLSRPLTIAFDTSGKHRPGSVPVVAHRLPDGSWTLDRASVTRTQMTVRASSFSLHLPAWFDPRAWLHWLGDRLASLIGGRTPPIDCAGGGPAWASVSKQTDEAHTCLVRNVDPASHAVRAEVQIKSNRGTALEVDIPPGASYTWVQDQPWAARSWVWRTLIHQDPNLMALLPAGATLTAGYLRPYADEDLSFQVQPSHWSLGYTLIGDIVDVLSSLGAESTSLTTLYLLGKCSGAVDYGSLSVHNPLSMVTFSSAFKCVLNEALSRLSSPAKAAGAARSLLGPGVDQADLATATKELTSVGGKLLTFGWILRLWPFFQAGWGTIPDVIHNLLTDGESTLINLHLRAAPGQAWTSSTLTITPHSLGAVTIGMTLEQASTAAGEPLAQVGDGVAYPQGGTTSGLSVSLQVSNKVRCVAAAATKGAPTVVTPQGFRLGGTLAQLKAVYGSNLRYVPGVGGINSAPGYVASYPDGNLVFWVNNDVVDSIAGGPGVLPSIDC